ncbi:MAG: YkvA family protein [Rhodovibrionaceae bacterium]|nr:YkvA family protein [Rhodovibrionaceae bacterium]
MTDESDLAGRAPVPYNPDKFARDKARVENGFWRKMRRTLGRVPFLEDAVAAWYCAFDPATPMQVRATLMAALAYFVIPTDMLPDIVPMLGFTDDAAVIAAAIRTVAPYITSEHRRKARAVLDEQTPD